MSLAPQFLCSSFKRVANELGKMAAVNISRLWVGTGLVAYLLASYDGLTFGMTCDSHLFPKGNAEV